MTTPAHPPEGAGDLGRQLVARMEDLTWERHGALGGR